MVSVYFVIYNDRIIAKYFKSDRALKYAKAFSSQVHEPVEVDQYTWKSRDSFNMYEPPVSVKALDY